MQAHLHDTLTVKGRRQGDEDRHGEIVEIHGQNGTPPYLVHWNQGSESLFFPSAGTVVEHPKTKKS
jgi:hypothetical protein